MKRTPKDPNLEDSELLLPSLPEPDLSDMDRVHRTVASDQLVDMLTNIGLADARGPDATALVNAVNPPTQREH